MEKQGDFLAFALLDLYCVLAINNLQLGIVF